ncbi:uncharacterized protein [Parasteatoda tepidariorum]|nr:uncharacterized protein LOC122268245 isoform X2 [Parasteatoda tepidariorum]XP_042896460.1 uncharacterized protein LOC122268245 isoform X2 [Parasteatoda tepidariorum]XP_042913178.1 uncharacterized protein LOC107438607 [Parasteatoda tepidariorum]
MAKIAKEEDVVGLFRNIMRPRQLRSEDIKNGREKIHIHGRGEYSCENCKHSWFSYFSWITVDLIEKRICKRWMMKCMHCLQPEKPHFELEHIEYMIKTAVDIYKGEYVSKKRPYQHPGQRRPPHLPDLCEKCKWGEERCWEYKYRCQ